MSGLLRNMGVEYVCKKRNRVGQHRDSTDTITRRGYSMFFFLIVSRGYQSPEDEKAGVYGAMKSRPIIDLLC
jgi:hypothetical protein